MADGTGIRGRDVCRGLLTAVAVAGTAWATVPTTRAAPAASCGVYTGVAAAGSATAEQVVDLARGVLQPAGAGWQTPIDRERPAEVGVAVFALG
jgi:hypothetical protein